MKYCRNRGFTLVELVLTIVVVAIVSLPLSMLVGRQLESVFESRDYTAAMNLARFEMEKVNNMDYANVGNASTLIDGYDVVRTVAYVQGDAFSLENLKQIKVEVRTAGSPDELFSLVMYRAKNVDDGI